MNHHWKLPEKKPTTKKAGIEFLCGHPRYDTMNWCNQSTSFARSIKIPYIDFPDKQAEETAFDMLSVDCSWDAYGIWDGLRDWQLSQGHLWQWGTNGRSGGYVVMYHGSVEPSGYKSRCTSCGQLNFAKIMAPPAPDDLEARMRSYVIKHNTWRPEVYLDQATVKQIALPPARKLAIVAEVRQEWGTESPSVTFHNKCGRCGENARVNFEQTHMKIGCYPGKDVYQSEVANGFEDYDKADVLQVVDLVWEFDQAVDDAIAAFVGFCDEHRVEDEEIMVAKTIRVPVEIE